MTEQPVIIATLEYEGQELIHNDLISSAFNLKQRIEIMMESGDMEGIGLDIMAAVTMTAFAYEAYLNFVGFKIIPEFVEFQNGKKKRNQIMAKLGIDWNDDTRPFSTINRLIEARDIMAHGKPYSVKNQWEAIGTHSELEEQIRSYRDGFESKIDYDLLRDAYDDVEHVWNMMLRHANISEFETFDRRMSGITFIAYPEPSS